MTRIKPHQFTTWETDEAKQIVIDDGAKFVRELYNKKFTFVLDHVKSEGFYRLQGWAYDLRPYLKRYWYKQHGTVYEAYAPTQELLRKATYGKIDKISEIR